MEKIKYLNNPFDTVIQATKELYPGLRADIQFDDRLRYFKFLFIRIGHCGETWFPEDGSTPLINVSTNIPFRGMIDVLAHELAYAAVGHGKGHGVEWRGAFEAIHKKYMEILFR
jgi:hypothetical protein